MRNTRQKIKKNNDILLYERKICLFFYDLAVGTIILMLQIIPDFVKFKFNCILFQLKVKEMIKS